MISVVLPTYNRGASILKAVESVISQSFHDWQLIIVDDGSTDNTNEVVEKLLHDDRIKYYKQNNQGVCSARNFGASKASGEYLIFLDSDDLLLHDALKIFNNCLESKPLLVFARVVVVNTDGAEEIKVNKFGASALKRGTISLLAGSYVIKKDIFVQVGGFDEKLKYAENAELALRVMFSSTAALEAIELKDVVLKYFRSTDGGSRNTDNKAFAIHRILDVHKTGLAKCNSYKANLYRRLSHFSKSKPKTAFKFAFKSILLNPWVVNSYYHLGFSLVRLILPPR